VSRSDSGSSSVFFASTSDGSTVVLKGSSHIVQELFANRVFEALQVPYVTVPATRVVEYTKREWQTAKATTKQQCQCATTRRALHQALDRAFFVVMQFVPGHSLCDLPIDVAKRIMLPSTTPPSTPPCCEPPQQATREHPVSCMQAIGSIVAIDVLLNNWDRLPIGNIWQNDGNAGNIMFDRTSLNAVAIDQTFTTINRSKYPQRFEQYLQNARALAHACAGSLTASGNEIDHGAQWLALKRLIESCVAFELDADCIHDIKYGFLLALHRMATVGRAGIAQIHHTLAHHTISTDWSDVWASGVAAIDLEFIDAVLEQMIAGAATGGVDVLDASQLTRTV
jgi:hypothetical protein